MDEHIILVIGFRFTVGFGDDFTRLVPEVIFLARNRHEFLPSIWDKRRTGPTAQLNYAIFSRLRGSKEADGFDVLWVHGYSTLNTLQAMVMAKALGIPLLLRAESRMAKQQGSALKRITKSLFFSGLKQLVDAVLPIGSSNAAYWRHFLGEELPQFPMPYAVDNDYFQSRSREASLRRDDLLRDLELDSFRPVILFTSKLQKRKRCEDLIEAYRNFLRDGGGGPQPYLVIVGDGEERASLEMLTEKYGLADVRFCGFRNQSELPRFFDIASVFVLPSRSEPWGLIVNEVMNAGRAVIVSDEVGCQPDLITDGVEGCVFPAGDVAALTAALRRVLASPEATALMGQRALQRIQNWSFEDDIRGLRQAIAQVTRKIQA